MCKDGGRAKSSGIWKQCLPRWRRAGPWLGQQGPSPRAPLVLLGPWLCFCREPLRTCEQGVTCPRVRPCCSWSRKLGLGLLGCRRSQGGEEAVSVWNAFVPGPGLWPSATSCRQHEHLSRPAYGSSHPPIVKGMPTRQGEGSFAKL